MHCYIGKNGNVSYCNKRQWIPSDPYAWGGNFSGTNTSVYTIKEEVECSYHAEQIFKLCNTCKSKKECDFYKSILFKVVGDKL